MVRVVEAINTVYGMTLRDVTNGRQTRTIVEARHMLWLLLREEGMTFQAIADRTGAKNHTTIMSGIKSTEALIETCPATRRLYEACRRLV